jgi:Protein of unknown function (DUF2561)
MAMQRESGGLRSPDAVDRVLVIGCAVIWLAVIGVGVAATVALVDLGTGRQPEAGSRSQTPWLLYVVIAVSAVIIVGAVPLLVRARRNALAEPAGVPVSSVPRTTNLATAGPARPAAEAPTEKLRVFGATADPITRDTSGNAPTRSSRVTLPPESIERMWLRVTAAIGAAMGVAMLAVAAATYLMAVDDNSAAWAALIAAAVVTAAMPVIPWLFLRQLRGRIAAVR